MRARVVRPPPWDWTDGGVTARHIRLAMANWAVCFAQSLLLANTMAGGGDRVWQSVNHHSQKIFKHLFGARLRFRPHTLCTETKNDLFTSAKWCLLCVLGYWLPLHCFQCTPCRLMQPKTQTASAWEPKPTFCTLTRYHCVHCPAYRAAHP